MQVKVATVDVMAEVQLLDKPEWIKTCKHLAEHFSNRLFSKYDDTKEFRLIFARYDLYKSCLSKLQRFMSAWSQRTFLDQWFAFSTKFPRDLIL